MKIVRFGDSGPAVASLATSNVLVWKCPESKHTRTCLFERDHIHAPYPAVIACVCGGEAGDAKSNSSGTHTDPYLSVIVILAWTESQQ